MEKIYLCDLSEKHNKYQIIKDLINNETISLEFIYKSDFIFTKHLRDFIETILSIFWISQKMLSRIILISDELNNNAIEYWTDKDWINKLRINLKKNNNEIILNMEAEDNGKWPYHKNASSMEELRENKLKAWYDNYRSIRWRWLFLIINQIADELYFKDSSSWGLIVWVNKRFLID